MTLPVTADPGTVRDVPPFRLWLEDDEIVLSHVACGEVVSPGALTPELARELGDALRQYARSAERAAKRLGMPGDHRG